MKPYLVSYYSVPGRGIVSVDTVCIGNPASEQEDLLRQINQRFPGNGRDAQLLGSYIEDRDDPEAAPVDLRPGSTVRQIFESVDVEGKLESVRKVGYCVFSGGPHDIYLTLDVAEGRVFLQLKPRLRGGGSSIKFRGDGIQPQTSVEQLKDTIKSILGSEATDIKLNIV